MPPKKDPVQDRLRDFNLNCDNGAPHETDPLMVEAICFALGESRLDEALDILISCWKERMSRY